MKESFTANFTVFNRFFNSFSPHLGRLSIIEKNDLLKYQLDNIYDLLKCWIQLLDKFKYTKKVNKKK